MDTQTVAILLTVYNRREKTLSCLRNCQEEIDSLRADGRYRFSIFLTDDGSTDGTAEVVSAQFPEVTITRGDGNLYWNRGMRASWEVAAKEDFDFYLWLNDDTILKRGAFGTLLENSFYLRHKAIVVGTAVNSGGEYSYGGRTRSGKIISPDPTIPVNCEIFNGNLVLVPKSVYEVVGMMDGVYSHSFGDFDYGVRADKAGISCVVAPGVLAECNRAEGLEKWRDGSYPIRERFRAIMGPKGRPVKEQFAYDVRRSNVFFAIGHFLSLTAKVIFAGKRKK